MASTNPDRSRSKIHNYALFRESERAITSSKKQFHPMGDIRVLLIFLGRDVSFWYCRGSPVRRHTLIIIMLDASDTMPTQFRYSSAEPDMA